MNRAQFNQLVAEALDALPAKFRKLMENVAVVVEDAPRGQGPSARMDDLLMGIFEGVPRTEKGIWNLPAEPDRVVLYQKNIEDYAREAAVEEGRPVEAIIREEVRMTVLHELGHYFGMDEEQLEDV